MAVSTTASRDMEYRPRLATPLSVPMLESNLLRHARYGPAMTFRAARSTPLPLVGGLNGRCGSLEFLTSPRCGGLPIVGKVRVACRRWEPDPGSAPLNYRQRNAWRSGF